MLVLVLTLSKHCLFRSQFIVLERKCQTGIIGPCYVFFLFCHSSRRETIYWLVNGCPHAFKTFERIQYIRETVVIISNKTMPVVSRVLRSQGPHNSNKLARIQ